MGMHWWDSLTVRRDKHTGRVLVKKPRTHKWVDARIVAGSRERERRNKKRGMGGTQP